MLDKHKKHDIINLTINIKFLICEEKNMENKTNRSINTINKAGKVGYIISIFLVIAAVTCMVMTAILTAAAIRVSNQEITVKVSTGIDIESSGNSLEMINSFIKNIDIYG